MKWLISLWALLLISCSGPRITSSWSAPDTKANPFKKIAVIGIITNEDNSMRQQMEKHMTGDLRELGFNAVAFTETFNDKDFPRDMRYDSARQKLMDAGIDAVITIGLLDKEKEKVFVRDQYQMSKEKNSFWYYYQTVLEAVEKNKGHYETITSYYWESNLYDLNNLSMIYSARSEFFEENDIKKMAHRYGKKLVEDMQKQMVLVK